MVNISKIKLDKYDRKILAELDKNCRIPATTLARKVGKSRQAVEYRINQLVKRGIITGFQAAFNPHKMGWKIFKIYLKLRNIPERKKQLFSFFRSLGLVYWMGEFSGQWDLIAGIHSKNDKQFYELKNKILSEYSDIIIEEHGDIIIDVQQYAKMYFTDEIVPPVEFAGKVIENEMDDLDYAILGIIVNEARISINDLARKSQSTATIVRNKLKRMEKLGIIIQYRIGIDLSKIGLELYKTIIKVDRYTEEDERKMLEYCSRWSNIHYYIRNIWQIEPEIVVESYHEYYEIIEALKSEFPHIIRSVDALLMISDEWTPGFRNLLHLDGKKRGLLATKHSTLP